MSIKDASLFAKRANILDKLTYPDNVMSLPLSNSESPSYPLRHTTDGFPRFRASLANINAQKSEQNAIIDATIISPPKAEYFRRIEIDTNYYVNEPKAPVPPARIA